MLILVDVNTLLEQFQTNPIPVIIIGFILIVVIWRAFRTASIYLGAKGFVKKSNKLRRKKYSGVLLNEFTEKKRARNTNSYKKLRRRAKNKVEAYFKYKEDELPGITNYANSKMLKRNRKKLIIFVSNGRKKIKRIQMKKAFKNFVELTNKYDCLDEFVLYLHNLPEAILNHQDYDIYIEEHDISIGYEIK